LSSFAKDNLRSQRAKARREREAKKKGKSTREGQHTPSADTRGDSSPEARAGTHREEASISVHSGGGLASGIADEALLGGPKGINVSLCYEGEQGVVYSLGGSVDKRRPTWPTKASSGGEKGRAKKATS